MRHVFLICFLLLSGTFAFGQDGSDMNYLKPEKLNGSHVGRRLHLDFYRESSGWGYRFGKDRNVDKVFLEINGKQLDFNEHREDDGFNNWFSEQYLESSDKKVRIREFKLLQVKKENNRLSGLSQYRAFQTGVY